MAENGHHHSSDKQDSRKLPPPSFSLPDDMEDEYELWSVRLPVGVKVQALHGMELDMLNNQKKLSGTFEHEGNEYGLTTGHAVEHEAFRLLLPEDKSKESDDEFDESDDDEMMSYMRPCEMTFDRHFNVVEASCLRDRPEAELAPRLETAPTPADPVRRSYASIPQASGLKRRWMPPGGTTNLGVAAKPRIPVNNDVRAKPANGSSKANGTIVSLHDVVSKSKDKDIQALPSKRPKADQMQTTPDSDSSVPIGKSSKKKAKKEKKKEKKAKKERKREKKEKTHKRDASL